MTAPTVALVRRRAMPARGAAAGGVRRAAPGAMGKLALLLGALIVVAAGIGAVWLSPGQVLAALVRPLGLELPWSISERDVGVLWQIRFPRVVLAAVVGAGLGCAGAAMQGVVRNPIADPGLVGVSGGAALGAVGYLVLGAPLVGASVHSMWLLPLSAFAGGAIATVVALAAARVDGRTSTVALLLAGVALTALTGSFVGGLVYVANEAQLRSITFWNLGSVGGATWPLVAAAMMPIGAAVLLLPRFAGALDRLQLGEQEAGHLGTDVERTRHAVIALVALAVGASVAACGGIGFIGLVVPHVLRGWLGPGHRALLPASAIGGAALLVLADLIARTVVAPTELPVGVLTALAGAPLLLAQVRRALREGTP